MKLSKKQICNILMLLRRNHPWPQNWSSEYTIVVVFLHAQIIIMSRWPCLWRFLVECVLYMRLNYLIQKNPNPNLNRFGTLWLNKMSVYRRLTETYLYFLNIPLNQKAVTSREIEIFKNAMFLDTQKVFWTNRPNECLPSDKTNFLPI